MFKKIREYKFRKQYNKLKEREKNTDSILEKGLIGMSIGSLKNNIALAMLNDKVSVDFYTELFPERWH